MQVGGSSASAWLVASSSLCEQATRRTDNIQQTTRALLPDVLHLPRALAYLQRPPLPSTSHLLQVPHKWTCSLLEMGCGDVAISHALS
jgi:hypothetical protein